VRTIRTLRLRLVPVTAANAGVLWEVLQQPDLRNYQDLPDLNRTHFLRSIGARPTRLGQRTVGRFEWLLHLLQGEEPLGWVSLRIPESNRSTAEIGYSVVRQYRRRGIATEAVAALVDEGFRRTEISSIRAYCLPENLASRAVLRRNGFEDEGMLARGATVAGKPVDVILHTLERDRWQSEATASRQATRS
jgi:[ribosomal protein S5]-alanine N-acetyltransferase